MDPLSGRDLVKRLLQLRGGGLVDHSHQQRCSNTNGLSQPRTLRSALGQEMPWYAAAGPVRIEMLLGPARASGR